MSVDPHDRDTILRHWKETPAYVVAETPPCLELADHATLPKGRRFESLRFSALDALEPPASWAMAVLLCPGDTTEDIAAWADSRDADEARFLFIHHPDTDVGNALQAWRNAGYPPPQLVEAETWLGFARLLGQHVNNVILRDHGPTGWIDR